MKIGNPAANSAPEPATPSAPAPKTVGHRSLATPDVTARDPAPAAGAIPAKADASAKIELSSTASTLLTSSATPEFDAEKVARISKSIDEGTFKIDPQAIADKLISNAQELLGSVKP